MHQNIPKESASEINLIGHCAESNRPMQIIYNACLWKHTSYPDMWCGDNCLSVPAEWREERRKRGYGKITSSAIVYCSLPTSLNIA